MSTPSWVARLCAEEIATLVVVFCTRIGARACNSLSSLLERLVELRRLAGRLLRPGLGRTIFRQPDGWYMFWG